jgi:ferredoxin-like protein FixX
MSVIFTANYSFSGGDVPINSDVFLMIDFVNLKIKSAQCFECAHKSVICVHKGKYSYVYEYLFVLYF